MGLPSSVALLIIKLQMNHEQSDTILPDSMALDISYGKFLKETNFNDFQALDLHDVVFVDLDSERVNFFLLFLPFLIMTDSFGPHGILWEQSHLTLPFPYSDLKPYFRSLP